MEVREVTAQLAPARGTIEFKISDHTARIKFFNIYDSLELLPAFEPVEVVGYPTHCVDLVKVVAEGGWRTAADDDELLLVVLGAVTVHFREGTAQVATGTAVDGEVLLLPRALDYQINAETENPALCLHFRTRGVEDSQ